MSEMKTTQDGLGRDPDGSGLSQAEPSGLGPSDFDPSRDDELASIAAIKVCVMTNGGCVCRHEDTSPRVAQSLNCKSRYRSARLGISLARASDERPTGPRPSGLGGDSPASAIDEVEAPGIEATRDAFLAGVRWYHRRPLASEESALRAANEYTARTLLSQSSEGE